MGIPLSGGLTGHWSTRIAVPVVVFFANQEGERVGGVGKGWEELAALPRARLAPGERERNPVKIKSRREV